MKKLITVIILFAVLLLFGCSSNEPVNTEQNTSKLPEKGVLDSAQYESVYQNRLAEAFAVSDKSNENTYEYIKIYAPNDDLRRFEAGGSVYFLSVYRCDKGSAALVFNSKNDKPESCRELIYYTKPISAEKLKAAKTLGDVYSMTGSQNQDEFGKYCSAAESSENFAPAANSASSFNLSLHLTDDGFYLVEYTDYMYERIGDEVTLSGNVKVASAEKCDSVFSDVLYKMITGE